MNRLANDATKLIEENISKRPEIQEQIAKILFALLKIRDVKYYKENSEEIILRFEKMIDGPKQCYAEDNTLYIPLSTFGPIIKAAQKFQNLTPEEVAIVQKYLESLISKNDDSLERYLSKLFRVESRNRYDIGAYDDPFIKLWTAVRTITNSRYHEDFELKAKKPILKDQVFESAKGYYLQRDYKIHATYNDLGFMVTKGNEITFVTMTQFGNTILITVNRNP